MRALQHLSTLRDQTGGSIFGHLHVLKAIPVTLLVLVCVQVRSSVLWFHQPSRELALHQKPPVSTPQLKHTFVSHGNAALAISLALENQKLRQACSLNPAPGTRGILVPAGRRVHLSHE